jgi:hypothetical protein
MKHFVLLAMLFLGSTFPVHAYSPTAEVSTCINTPIEERGADCVGKLENFSKGLKKWQDSQDQSHASPPIWNTTWLDLLLHWLKNLFS